MLKNKSMNVITHKQFLKNTTMQEKYVLTRNMKAKKIKNINTV